jgi:hypothetical protein
VRTRFVAVSLGVAVAAVGCGTARLTHRELLVRADTVCAKYNRRVAKLGTPQGVRQIRAFAVRVRPIYRSSLSELRALRPPKEDERAFDAWLASDERIQLDVEQLAHANAATVRNAVAQAAADDARSTRLARALGLDVCGKP